MHSWTTRLALPLLLATVAALPARAQGGVTGVTAATAGREAGAASTAADATGAPDSARVATLDERVRQWWQAPAHRPAPALRLTLRAIDWTASPGVVVLPPVVWGVASLTDAAGPARGARRTTEAVLLGAATTGLLKLAFGRARPQVSGRSDDWRFGRGREGGRYQAFPSGHTTVAVAAAATWIAESRGTAPVVLGAATFAAGAGLARMVFDKHWLTDVLAGAVVGTASALAVQAIHRSAGAGR